MATLAVALLVGACGGSEASEDKAGSSDGKSEASMPTTPEGAPTGEEAKGKESAATTQKGSGGSASKPGGSSTAQGSTGGDGSTPTTQPPTEPTPLEASLKSSCVKAGGQQSITVKVKPGTGVAYNSYYPDGRSGLSDGFYGGNNGKNVDNEDGTWTDTWTIAPNAPAGKVRVAVLASHVDYQSVERDLFFDLVPATGICP